MLEIDRLAMGKGGEFLEGGSDQRLHQIAELHAHFQQTVIERCAIENVLSVEYFYGITWDAV
jgi:hypothetical protein